MKVIDEQSGDSIVCDTLEEALAVAASDMEPGDEIVLHAEDCDATVDGSGCTCTPQIVTVKARAES